MSPLRGRGETFSLQTEWKSDTSHIQIPLDKLQSLDRAVNLVKRSAICLVRKTESYNPTRLERVCTFFTGIGFPSLFKFF